MRNPDEFWMRCKTGAFRTVREVRMYVNAAHELDGENYELERSIDEQIVQKVLPKLHGN